MIYLAEPSLTNLKTNEGPGNRHPLSQTFVNSCELVSAGIANHFLGYANWKTSTEATVAAMARSPCATRAMRWIWFVI